MMLDEILNSLPLVPELPEKRPSRRNIGSFEDDVCVLSFGRFVCDGVSITEFESGRHDEENTMVWEAVPGRSAIDRGTHAQFA